MIEVNGYPAPAGAVLTSLSNSGEILIHIPGQATAWHTVKVPASPQGLAALREILRAREARPQATIGATLASPTQSIVDAWLRENRPAPAGAKQSVHEIPPSVVDELLEGLF